MSSKFCRMPYEAVAVTSQGKVSPCCAFENKLANDYQTITDYWNSDLKKNIIQSFDAGYFHPGCRSCKESEESKIRSKRQKYNSNNNTLPFNKNIPEPHFVEVALGNQCNVACVTCGSDFSTGWRQYDRQMPTMFEERKEFLKVNFKIDRDFIDNLLLKMRNNPTMKIELIGGEPFFNKEGIYLLNKMAAENMPNEVAMTSNCSLITDSAVDTLSKLNVHICPSIDATGSMYTYIRNFDFDIVEQNLLKLVNAKVKMIIMPVFSVFNVWQIPTLLKWMLKMDFPPRTKIKLNNFVHGPDYCSIKNIPHELLRDVIDEVKELDVSRYVSAQDKSAFIDSLTNYPQEDDEEALARTLAWIQQCNKIRGVNIQDLDDDLALYMEYLEHGI